MTTLVIIVISFVCGIGIARLFPYVKDFKVTPDEKDKIEDIIIDTSKNIFEILKTNGSSDLVLTFSNIIMEELEKNDINDFSKEDIEMILNILAKKLQNQLVENK